MIGYNLYMNLKDLENFYNVSNYKSFSVASKMLGVTQPTLSESIKRLESDIGVQLFYRSKAGIQLTPNGSKTLIYVKDLLRLKNEIATISQVKNHINHSINLGCHTVVAGYFVKDFLLDVYKRYSNITINLKNDHSKIIQKNIQDGQIDIGVVVNPIKNPDLIIKKVCDDKICIWKSTKSETRTDQFIADIGLSQVQSILRSWKQVPSHHISTTDFNITGELAQAGIGFAILPEKYVKQKKLKLKQVYSNIFYKDELAIVFRPEFGKNEIERFLIDSIENCFKK